jgi:hypothetical protein
MRWQLQRLSDNFESIGHMKLRLALPLYVFWRLWRRDRRRDRANRQAPPPSDDRDIALAEITLALAESLYGEELSAADTIDLKAVGLGTADVAALTILVTFHRDVSQWWAAAILLVISGVCFFTVLRRRFWWLGTEPRKFWDENTDRPRLVVLESALASTEENMTHNEPFLRFKARWFFMGYVTLALGIAVLLITALWHAYR